MTAAPVGRRAVWREPSSTTSMSELPTTAVRCPAAARASPSAPGSVLRCLLSLLELQLGRAHDHDVALPGARPVRRASALAAVSDSNVGVGRKRERGEEARLHGVAGAERGVGLVGGGAGRGGLDHQVGHRTVVGERLEVRRLRAELVPREPRHAEDHDLAGRGLDDAGHLRLLRAAEQQERAQHRHGQERADDPEAARGEPRPEGSQEEEALLPAVHEAAERLAGVPVRQRDVDLEDPGAGAAAVDAQRDREPEVPARLHRPEEVGAHRPLARDRRLELQAGRPADAPLRGLLHRPEPAGHPGRQVRDRHVGLVLEDGREQPPACTALGAHVAVDDQEDVGVVDRPGAGHDRLRLALVEREPEHGGARGRGPGRPCRRSSRRR